MSRRTLAMLSIVAGLMVGSAGQPVFANSNPDKLLSHESGVELLVAIDGLLADTPAPVTSGNDAILCRTALGANGNVARCMATCLKTYTWKHCVWMCTGKPPLAAPSVRY